MTDRNTLSFGWDASCFVAWFSEEQGRYEMCDAIIEAAKRGRVKVYTSYLTLVEVIKVPGLYVSESEDKVAEFFRNEYIKKVALDWWVAKIARDLQIRHGLDGRDAVHLATAIHLKVDEFHTYDDGLLKLDSQIRDISLCIRQPDINYQIDLLKE